MKIKELLNERGWSEYKLSKESGVAQSTLTNMFKRNNAPSLPTLEAVCLGFGITLSQFFSNGNEAVVLSERELDILNCWSRLTKEQQEILLQLIKKI